MADEKDRENPDDDAEGADDGDSEEEAEAPAKKPSAPADRDEDDDEDDDDEDEEPPPRKQAKAAAPSPRPAVKRKRPPPAKPVIPPESQIAAPSRQTLGMLAAMVGATLLMWGSARFACNAHPAQTRKPREVSTAELSRDPKDAALELAQRWASYDFKGALELAKGPIADELQKAQADCEKDPSCDAKRKALDGRALATAALLSRGPGSAKVRVSAKGGALGDQTVVYTLEQDGSAWKVGGRGADVPTPAPTPTPAAPTPSGSAPANAPSAQAPH